MDFLPTTATRARSGGNLGDASILDVVDPTGDDDVVRDGL